MKYEYKEFQRSHVQHHEMERLGAEGWKLIDVRHKDKEPSWADELLFMREEPKPRCNICGKTDGWFGLHFCSE